GTLYGLAISGAMGEIGNLSFLQVMVFSSLIVAVDPVAVLAVFNEIGVNHVLYFLVFGESLLNDGVTVVLYKVFQAYNNMDEISGFHIFLGLVKFFVVCLGGLLIGIIAGIATALLTKHAQHVKVAQPLIIYSMAYLGFLMAELFEFSGIISIIGCGLVQMQYAFHNISDKSNTTIKYFTKVISSANEIIIFLFLGLVMVNDDHDWHTGFTLWTIFFCLVYRFIIIFGMSYIINWLDVYRVRKIGLHEQFMIAYGGLRGAVCFSLVALLNADDIPCKNMFVTTTLSVILFTVFVQGITIKPLVYFLQISMAPEKNQTMYKELNAKVTDHLMAGVEDIIGDHGRNHLRERLEYLDSTYLKPLLQIAPDPRDADLKIFYENLLLKEHYKYLKLSGAKTEDEIPDLPHVNTELLLSTLASGHHPRIDMPTRERKSEPIMKAKAKSAPSTPAITIEMEPIVMRKKNFLRSHSVGEKTEIDAKALRGLLLSQRNSRMAFAKYDRNLTSHDDMHSEIRKKTNRNRRLQKLMSVQESPALRRKSWSDSDAQLAEERGNARKAAPRHAMTVDLGNTGRQGSVDDTLSPNSPGWTLDSVFEEDESETQPMMDSSDKKISRSSSRLSSKHRLERQMGLDAAGGEGDNASLNDDTKVLTDSSERPGKSEQARKKGKLERGGSDPTGGHQGETRI
ncbi:Sodium/hydrogen exchanger 2, partial [Bulinus truncatus]